MDHRYAQIIKELYLKCGSYNPFVISNALNIEIKYVPFGKSPLGQVAYVYESPIILLNEYLSESNERFFVCAHELYHALEHTSLSSYYISNRVAKSKMESEANSFATFILFNEFIEINSSLPASFDELKNSYGFPESSKMILGI
ncbi:ImmA/IrrE family metallo-endopeptidase [Carnobacterium sp. ISL-102]|uniref:ImmA/IrrE family metallo-endopeptidase n=1 Tax=Carnobacterium sp. ISL-102 TaxID=2819142 RepID=UPI001BEA74BA|nr:ImmA/IrrE family metallo-endopeptidase [Carnobacterium sp. ISL-102]MBT2732081.1 ImmA/IrrE family metallo-endopeptidase [Carnobacterium sp. ISL-102]